MQKALAAFIRSVLALTAAAVTDFNYSVASLLCLVTAATAALMTNSSNFDSAESLNQMMITLLYTLTNQSILSTHPEWKHVLFMEAKLMQVSLSCLTPLPY